MHCKLTQLYGFPLTGQLSTDCRLGLDPRGPAVMQHVWIVCTLYVHQVSQSVLYVYLNMSVCQSVCLSISLSLSIFIYRSTYLRTYLPIYLSTYLPTYLKTHPSIHLSIYFVKINSTCTRCDCMSLSTFCSLGNCLSHLTQGPCRMYCVHMLYTTGITMYCIYLYFNTVPQIVEEQHCFQTLWKSKRNNC